jgi:replicative DNA helicase
MKALPHSIEAEQGTLCSMMNGATAAAVQVIGKRGDAWFHVPANQKLYAGLVEWWEAGKVFDWPLFSKAMADANRLNAMGGDAHLTEVFTFAHGTLMLPMYLESLKEKRWLRHVITVCTEQVRRAYHEQNDVEGLLREVETNLTELVSRSLQSSKQRVIQDIIGTVIHNLGEPEKVLGISTGFKKLDALVGGLAATSKIVIGAAISGGKSSFAQCLANSLAVDREIPTAMFTFEMSAEECAMRLIQIRSGVSTRAVAIGEADMMEMDRYNAAATAISESPLHIIEEQIDVAGIRARCMNLKPRVAIIDYLQIVPEPWRPKEGTTERLDRMSAATKQIAQQLGITVIELTQLTTDDKTGKVRTRFSQGITADANQLWIIEGEDDESKAVNKKQITVGKQRDGARDVVVFDFIRKLTTFREPK